MGHWKNLFKSINQSRTREKILRSLDGKLDPATQSSSDSDENDEEVESDDENDDGRPTKRFMNGVEESAVADTKRALTPLVVIETGNNSVDPPSATFTVGNTAGEPNGNGSSNEAAALDQTTTVTVE